MDGELQEEPKMEGHGYEEDGYEIENDDGSWNQYESFAMRRGGNYPQGQIHMTQQMTTKIPPAYDRRTS